MAFDSIDPTSGERLERFETISAPALERRLARARDAFRAERGTPFQERAERLRRAADLLEDGARSFGRLMTVEMGKPIGQAVAEAEKCAWVCRHYAEHGADYLADEEVETDVPRSFVRYQPLGPVLAIMPWNFPFWQVFRFAAPSLMAGNVGLLKHAPNVPQCALAIEGIFRRAGFPEGAFQNLFVDTDAVPGILGDRRVRAATVTGSVRAGRAVAAEAGRHVKKVVLELGGSDPFIVMPSADLDAALETAVNARMQNNGESCIAAKRFIVAGDVYEDFRDGLVERIGSLTVGNPLEEDTDVGPLAREDLRDELDRQVRETVEAGARVLLGGEVPDRDGWFYEPTVLEGIPEDAPARREELFGPVACLFRVPDARAALALANDTDYGLGAAAWTRDPDERRLFVDGLEAGGIAIDGMTASDPRLPFGGVKDSGHGRELGRHGIREFVNVKSVKIHDEQLAP
ncbi:MAG TPA: NAD-dependent succinate-semialdehyde dehydrogenase [Gemmatimonadota bacterium]|nr:NAD-dependent succinate-semialdehyde dehydrogenase [Gemmatimonadota bacterium]